MQRKFAFVPGEYYHIYNRGVEKRTIFQEDADWRHFHHLLHLCNGKKPLVFKTIQGEPFEYDVGQRMMSISFYSFMPNHFHLIGREDKRGGLSKFLGRLQTAHSMYFNTKYERSGALFCRPFKAKHINTDEYFRWVVSYVHLNPLDIFEPGWKESGLKNVEGDGVFLKTFRYSSYPDYFGGGRKEARILNKESLPINIADLDEIDKNMTLYKAFQGEPLER